MERGGVVGFKLSLYLRWNIMSRQKWKKKLNTGRWRTLALGSLRSSWLGAAGSTRSTSFLPGTDQQPRWSHGDQHWGVPKPHAVFFPHPRLLLTSKQAQHCVPHCKLWIRDFRASCHKVSSSDSAFRDCPPAVPQGFMLSLSALPFLIMPCSDV